MELAEPFGHEFPAARSDPDIDFAVCGIPAPGLCLPRHQGLLRFFQWSSPQSRADRPPSAVSDCLPSNRPCSSTLSRVSVLGRPYFFEEPGGNCLSNFSTPLFRFWMFLLELLEIVSLELPLHTSRFVFVSNRSTTNVPTLYVSVVVVASPKPPPPKPPQPQPPPNPS